MGGIVVTWSKLGKKWHNKKTINVAGLPQYPWYNISVIFYYPKVLKLFTSYYIDTYASLFAYKDKFSV